MEPTFFPQPEDYRKWLIKYHDKKGELLVGFYKKKTGRASITWPESVDQALCFGWIDGIRKSLGAESYTIRFTPRKPKSNWSAVNLKRFTQLKKLGLIYPSGQQAFERMDSKKAKKASFEQGDIQLGNAEVAKLKANKKAWPYFQKLAPSYKKSSIWWVISAKKEETRWKRLDILIKASEAEEKIPMLNYTKKK